MGLAFNLWISMSLDFQQELVPLVQDGEPAAVEFPGLNHVDQVTLDFFRGVHDAGAMERLFKLWETPNNSFRVWSIYTNKPQGLPQIRDDLDQLMAIYPQDFSVVGSWRTDNGLELGIKIDEEGQETGEAIYPIPSQIVKFMPDVWNGDEPPTYSPATEPGDVVLMFGQHPRRFDSFYG